MELIIRTNTLFNNVKKIMKIYTINPINYNQELVFISVLEEKIKFFFYNDRINLVFEINNLKENLKIKKTGSFFINIKLLNDLLSKIKDEWICIEKTGNTLIINNLSLINSFVLKLNLIESENFPKLDFRSECINHFTLPKNLIKQIVNQVGFAISLKVSSEFSSGINFKIEGNILTVTGTDNIFLAQKKINILNPNNINTEFIVPLFLMIDAEKLIGDFNQEVLFFINNYKNVIIQCESYWIKGPLIQGTYSKEIQNLSSNFFKNKNLEIIKIEDFAAFLNVLDLSVILSKKDRATAIELFFEKTTAKVEIVCTSNNNEIGKIKEYYSKLLIKKQEKNFNVIFYYNILIQVLKAFNECNSVNFNINPENKYIIITSDDDHSLSQLLLPCVKIS